MTETYDTWREVRIVAEGDAVTVRRGPKYGAMEDLLRRRPPEAVNGVTAKPTYDAWGGMVEKADDGGCTETWEHRYGDRLLGVASTFSCEGTVTFQYGDDGKGRGRTVGGRATRMYHKCCARKWLTMWRVSGFQSRPSRRTKDLRVCVSPTGTQCRP